MGREPKYKVGDFVKFFAKPEDSIDPNNREFIQGKIVNITNQDNRGWFDYDILWHDVILIVSEDYIDKKVD